MRYKSHGVIFLYWALLFFYLKHTFLIILTFFYFSDIFNAELLLGVFSQCFLKQVKPSNTKALFVFSLFLHN